MSRLAQPTPDPPDARRDLTAHTHPTLSQANIMMSMTECNSWCADAGSDWPTKCTWKTGVCSACAECSDASVANCQYWCDDHSGSWKNKCSWGSDVCSGCAECKDVDPATTGCESWCTVNGASWVRARPPRHPFHAHAQTSTCTQDTPPR